MTPTHRSAARIGRQAAELSLAVPQVVSHRLTRMAASGPLLSARDQREFTGMVLEKYAAFHESWMAMTLQSFQMQQRAMLAFWQVGSPPWIGGNQVLDLFSKGLAPVHRRAVANARRLGRVRR